MGSSPRKSLNKKNLICKNDKPRHSVPAGKGFAKNTHTVTALHAHKANLYPEISDKEMLTC